MCNNPFTHSPLCANLQLPPPMPVMQPAKHLSSTQNPPPIMQPIHTVPTLQPCTCPSPPSCTPQSTRLPIPLRIPPLVTLPSMSLPDTHPRRSCPPPHMTHPPHTPLHPPEHPPIPPHMTHPHHASLHSRASFKCIYPRRFPPKLFAVHPTQSKIYFPPTNIHQLSPSPKALGFFYIEG